MNTAAQPMYGWNRIPWKEVERNTKHERKMYSTAGHRTVDDVTAEAVASAAETSSALRRQELCAKSKNRRTVAVKEAVTVLGRESGITNRALAEGLGIGASAVTQRVDVARASATESSDVTKLRNV